MATAERLSAPAPVAVEPSAWLAEAGPALDEGGAARLRARLSASEAARFERLGRAERRAQFLVGHALARALLQHLGAASVELAVDADGRRVCSDPQWSLSLAHSGRWVVALVGARPAHGEVGIDLEARREARGGQDRAWPGHRPPRAIEDSELAVWTQREARFKAAAADAPAWQLRVPAATVAVIAPDGVPPPDLWLAVANVRIPPRLCLVKAEGDSYNRAQIDLRWQQADS